MLSVEDDQVFSRVVDEGGRVGPRRTWHSAIPAQFHNTSGVAGDQGSLFIWNEPGDTHVMLLLTHTTNTTTDDDDDDDIDDDAQVCDQFCCDLTGETRLV